MFEIETGIPMPERSTRGRREMYPFAALAESESPEASFFVPGKKLSGSTISAARKKYARSFPSVTDNKGTRVWRGDVTAPATPETPPAAPAAAAAPETPPAAAAAPETPPAAAAAPRRRRK